MTLDPELLRYLDGAMDAQAQDALVQRLRADPQARRDLVALALLQAQLREVGASGLPQPVPRRPHRVLLVGAALAAVLTLATTLLVWSWARAPGGPTVVACDGAVAISRDGTALSVAPGMPLRAQDTLTLSGSGSVQLGWAGGGSVSSTSPCLLTIGADATHWLRLDEGTIAVAIPHRPDRTITLTTPAATITDLGTSFTLTHAHETTQVAVRTGRVLLATTRGWVEVPAQREATAMANQPPAVTLPPPPVLPPVPVLELPPGGDRWDARLHRPLAFPQPAPLPEPERWRLLPVHALVAQAGALPVEILSRSGAAPLGSLPLPPTQRLRERLPPGLAQLIITTGVRAWSVTEPALEFDGRLRASAVQALAVPPLLQPDLGGVLRRNEPPGRVHALALLLPSSSLRPPLHLGSRLTLATPPADEPPGSVLTPAATLRRLVAQAGFIVVGQEQLPTVLVEGSLLREQGPALTAALRALVPELVLVEEH